MSVERAAEVLGNRPWCEHEDTAWIEHDVIHHCYECDAAALAAAGCLRDDREGETVTEWGVRVHTKNALAYETFRTLDRSMAVDEVRWLVEHLGNGRRGKYNGRPFVGAHIMSRQRTRFPDVVTDWTPVTDGA